jgi:hypothetical protein
LGLSNFIHCYLVRSSEALTELPILAAQLGPSEKTAVPHAVLEIDTEALQDNECRVCNWNLAVSRPGVEGVCKGGNWTRGTGLQSIAKVWRAFRESEPSIKRARGFWKEDALVPMLDGPEIVKRLDLLRMAPRGQPELLLSSPFPLGRVRSVIVFDEGDRASLEAVIPQFAQIPVLVRNFPGYTSVAGAVVGTVRFAVDEHLAGRRARIDFDDVRPKKDG